MMKFGVGSRLSVYRRDPIFIDRDMTMRTLIGVEIIIGSSRILKHIVFVVGFIKTRKRDRIRVWNVFNEIESSTLTTDAFS